VEEAHVEEAVVEARILDCRSKVLEAAPDLVPAAEVEAHPILLPGRTCYTNPGVEEAVDNNYGAEAAEDTVDVGGVRVEEGRNMQEDLASQLAAKVLHTPVSVKPAEVDRR